MTMIPISQIRIDGGTQPRAVIDYAAVQDYMDMMRDGVKFPPIIVFYDGSDYWLADGFHRKEAAFGADMDEIACEIHQGTQQDAQWFSFSANKSNGLRRTNEDKQRAANAALVHPNGAGLSDSKIAMHVGCSREWVRQIRERLVSCKHLQDKNERTVTRGDTTYEQKTANIGRKAKPKPSRDGGTRVATDMPWRETEQAQSHVGPIATPKAEAPPSAAEDSRVVPLLRAMFTLAEHNMHPDDFVRAIPDENIGVTREKAGAVFSFASRIYDGLGKRKRDMEA